MAKYGSGVNTRVYFDQYDLSGSLNASDQSVDQEGLVVTSFSDTGPRRITGGYDVDHSDMGFLEAADEGYDEKIFAAIGDGSDHYLTKLFGANAENSVSYDHVVRLTGQPRSAKLGSAILLNFSSKNSNGAARGLVLANVTTTGAENRTGRNMGATVSGQIFAVVFRVITFSGTNITLTVQESTDDGVDPYAAISGLTSGALTAAGVVRATTTAATEAWKRATVAGTFTSAVILVTAGIVQGSA